MLLEARRQSFTCMNIYPFCPLRHIALVSAFRSFANLTSHTLPASQIVRLEERKIVGRLGLSHCSQPSRIMLQHVTTLCMCHGRLPSIGPIWRRQASHGHNIIYAMGEGKSGPVETGLTGPVATALNSEGFSYNYSVKIINPAKVADYYSNVRMELKSTVG